MTDVKPINLWGWRAAKAIEAGIDTAGEYILLLALQGIALPPDAAREVMRVYGEYHREHCVIFPYATIAEN